MKDIKTRIERLKNYLRLKINPKEFWGKVYDFQWATRTLGMEMPPGKEQEEADQMFYKEFGTKEEFIAKCMERDKRWQRNT